MKNDFTLEIVPTAAKKARSGSCTYALTWNLRDGLLHLFTATLQCRTTEMQTLHQHIMDSFYHFNMT